jgi:uncharacterized protein
MPLWLPMLPAAVARMQTERLGIVPAGGGETVLFQVEIAATEQQQAVGLMFRTELADDRGMLFHYGAEKDITMWMRNTYISLDMLFIGADGIIKHIAERTEPMSERIISAGLPSAAVLEIPGGASQRRGIRVGDRVLHPLFGSKPLK